MPTPNWVNIKLSLPKYAPTSYRFTLYPESQIVDKIEYHSTIMEMWIPATRTHYDSAKKKIEKILEKAQNSAKYENDLIDNMNK